MKVRDVILEYKLTHHEIMALFDVIEKQRYMPVDRAVDKATSKWGAIKKDLGNLIKPQPQNKSHLSAYPKNKQQRIEPSFSESINEAGLNDTLKKAAKWGAREISPEMPNISSEQLLRIWKERGSPNDSDEIIYMLVHDVQMPRKMVLNAMKKASSEQPNVKAFANLVRKAGIEKQIIQYCDVILDKRSLSGEEERALKKRNSNGISNVLRNLSNQDTMYDSLNNTGNMISEEATIKDSDIKDLFVQLAQTHPKLASVPTIKNTEEEIKKWADSIKRTEDAVVKMNLVKEIVNYLADIKGTDDWKKVVSGVENIIRTDKTIQDYVKSTTDTKDNQFLNIAINNIRSGAKMEKRNFLVANKFLSESGLMWSNIGVKPDLVDGDIVLKPVIKGTSVFVEDFVKVITSRRIDEQVKTIGRCKKV